MTTSEPLAAPRLLLAFDFGLRHIGVASGQSITGTATPLTTLPARAGVPDWSAVARLVAEWRPDLLVVGLPLNMDATESPMSERARRFAARLGRETRRPVVFADERLTSRAANTNRDSGTATTSQRSAGRDTGHARAAVLIAETWLNDQRSGAATGHAD
jgi:putative Holliday junction resolvase